MGPEGVAQKVPLLLSLRKSGTTEYPARKLTGLALGQGHSVRISDDEAGPSRAERPESSRQRGRQGNRPPPARFRRPDLAAADLLYHPCSSRR